LYVEDLPPTTTEALIQIFQAHPGFTEVRYVAPKNCAFVEFEDEFQAGIALNYLNGFKLSPDKAMKIRYANK
jgi:U2 small nuclear ribonucleoprotein B''